MASQIFTFCWDQVPGFLNICLICWKLLLTARKNRSYTLTVYHARHNSETKEKHIYILIVFKPKPKRPFKSSFSLLAITSVEATRREGGRSLLPVLGCPSSHSRH